jgi:hypothetical protein
MVNNQFTANESIDSTDSEIFPEIKITTLFYYTGKLLIDSERVVTPRSYLYHQ